ncbi:MAG: hypothetical protein JEZ08_22515 [Clostridiales bacterium]|nr:hypothetical protein [Clostridiales bacterium]
MKAIFYRDHFLRSIYTLLEERVPIYRIPNINMEFIPEENRIEAWFHSMKNNKGVISILKQQNLISRREYGKAYLDMDYILRLSLSDYSIHSYGVVFTNPHPEGIIKYSFGNIKNTQDVIDGTYLIKNVVQVNAGSFLHAAIKLDFYLRDKEYCPTEYDLIGNSHELRYLSNI